MFDKPVLIFSNYCIHSKNFIQALMKYPDLYDSFIRLNIDVNPETKKRPDIFFKIQQTLNRKITKVPTIILTGGQDVLSDVESFKWLDYQIKQLTKIELSGFNSNEMTSFSDNYSLYGSTDINNANEQSFKFYNNNQLGDDNYLGTDKTFDINNPNKTTGFLDDLESEHKNVDLKSIQDERQFFDQSRQQTKISHEDFTNYSQNQNGQMDQQKRQTINFTDPNFGLSGKINNGQSTLTQKEKEFQTKLDQIEQERKEMDSTLQQRR